MPRRKARGKKLDGHSTGVIKEMREEHKKKDMKINNNRWSGVNSRPHPVFEKVKNKRKKK
jgi:hypothetical protein